MEKTVVWWSLHNGGDGSAYPIWFLTEDDAEYDQDHLDEGWGETCTGRVETYIGSNIYLDAIENSNNLKK